MKRLTKMFLCFALLAASMSATAQEKAFKKLAKIKGVESAAFSLNGEQSPDEEIKLGSMSLELSKPLAEKVEHIRSFAGEGRKPAHALRKGFMHIVKKEDYEPVSQMSDEDGNLALYYQKDGKQPVLVYMMEFDMNDEDENEPAFVIYAMSGKFDIKDLKFHVRMGRTERLD